MKLYQEIIFLQHTFKGKWVVENVEPYYRALLLPRMTIGRHFFWSNFHIPKIEDTKSHKGNLSDRSISELQEAHGIELPANTKNARKVLRNAVDPKLGGHILKAAVRTIEQPVLL